MAGGDIEMDRDARAGRTCRGQGGVRTQNLFILPEHRFGDVVPIAGTLDIATEAGKLQVQALFQMQWPRRLDQTAERPSQRRGNLG